MLDQKKEGDDDGEDENKIDENVELSKSDIEKLN